MSHGQGFGFFGRDASGLGGIVKIVKYEKNTEILFVLFHYLFIPTGRPGQFFCDPAA